MNLETTYKITQKNRQSFWIFLEEAPCIPGQPIPQFPVVISSFLRSPTMSWANSAPHRRNCQKFWMPQPVISKSSCERPFISGFLKSFFQISVIFNSSYRSGRKSSFCGSSGNAASRTARMASRGKLSCGEFSKRWWPRVRFRLSGRKYMTRR